MRGSSRIQKGIVLLTLLCTLVPGNATIVHLIDVAALVGSSDIIICGDATSVTEQGKSRMQKSGDSIVGRNMVAVVTVSETLKGSVGSSDLSVEFFVPDQPSGMRPIPPHQYGIFFLQRQISGYRVSDPSYPFLPAVPNGKSRGGDPLNIVAWKLADVITYPSSTDAEVNAAMDALASIQTSSGTEALRHALVATSGNLQLHIASKLVARNDITGLELVENALLHPEGSLSQLKPILAGSLAGLTDPRSIPTLIRLLKTHDQQITRSVAIALRKSGSEQALSPLSGLLDNGELQVRYSAVVGMGEITRQDEWTPALDEFHNHEGKYLAYWRDWAQSNLHSETPQ